MSVRSITEAGDVRGMKVIVRVDYNVPLNQGFVRDDMRIRKSLATISYLRNAGAKVILLSHIEDKAGSGLEAVAQYLQAYIPVTFIKEFLSQETKAFISRMKDGDVVLFENVRTNPGEVNNDSDFARALASYGDIYVNDAFSVSHRSHASVVGIPRFLPHFAGFQLVAEIDNLKTVFNPPHPFIFILGGAKFDSKLPLIRKFLGKADHVFVGGALVNNILKARGYSIGKSLVSEGEFALPEIIMNPKLIISPDVIVQSGNDVIVKKIEDVGNDDVIVDIGPSAVEQLRQLLVGAQFVLWNGPMGNYEIGFKQQSMEFARAIVDSGVKAALGGGDTVAALASLGLDERANGTVFVSTGGGAMIEYLLNETLPGIEALSL